MTLPLVEEIQVLPDIQINAFRAQLQRPNSSSCVILSLGLLPPRRLQPMLSLGLQAFKITAPLLTEVDFIPFYIPINAVGHAARVLQEQQQISYKYIRNGVGDFAIVSSIVDGVPIS